MVVMAGSQVRLAENPVTIVEISVPPGASVSILSQAKRSDVPSGNGI